MYHKAKDRNTERERERERETDGKRGIEKKRKGRQQR